MNLLVELVWPAFFLLVIYLGQDSIRGILHAIRNRIERGDEFEIGSTGIKLKHPPLLEDKKNPDEDTANSDDENEVIGIYLAHTAKRDPGLDKDGQIYFRIQIFLESEPDTDLSQVSKVIYHLHPDFNKPDRVVTDARTQFKILTAGWGQFNLWAEVFLSDRDKPLILERYINF